MKKINLLLAVLIVSLTVSAQTKVELYDLIKKMLTDSTGYSNVGDWAVGKPKKFPVKWNEDRIIMSEDTAINFYRSGTVDITINNNSFMQANKQPAKWNVMLKGPRMGYTSFSIISTPLDKLSPKFTIDSLFGKKPFTARLLKSCDVKALTGYYYYQVKLPKKDVAFIKISWLTVSGNAAVRIDCYDEFSNYAAKLDCR